MSCQAKEMPGDNLIFDDGITHIFDNSTNGGSGGIVLKVTNLNASGEGSLKAALDYTAKRIIVFEVGGVIDLNMEKLRIEKPNVTIAGHTAPGPGITIIKGGIFINTHDVVIKHIAIRPGDADQPKRSGWEPDGISISGEKCHHILIDHCSVTWAVDENLSASGPRYLGPENTSRNITFSNNIIAEGLNDSSHSKGKHSKGTLIHDYCQDIAVVGNLYAHNIDRNPYFKSSTKGIVVNNIIYNPGNHVIKMGYPMSEWEGKNIEPQNAKLSIVGNILYNGINSSNVEALVQNEGDAYVDDNLAYKRNGSPLPIIDNTVNSLNEKPVWLKDFTAMSSLDVLGFIKKNVGSRPAQRDAIDTRIIDDLVNKTGKIIDSQNEVGGYPRYETTTRSLEIPTSNVDGWLKEMEMEVLYEN